MSIEMVRLISSYLTIALLEMAVGMLIYHVVTEYFRYKHQLLKRRAEIEIALQSIANGQPLPVGWSGLSAGDDEKEISGPADWLHARQAPPVSMPESRLAQVQIALSPPTWPITAFTRVIATDISRDAQSNAIKGFAAVDIGALLAGQIPKLIPGVHIPESTKDFDITKGFLRQYLSGSKYIAHGVSLDLNVLLPWLSLGKANSEGALLTAKEDTHSLARERLRSPIPPNWKLHTLVTTLGLSCDVKPHTALGDAIRTAQLAVLLYTGRRVRITLLTNAARKELAPAGNALGDGSLENMRMQWMCYFAVSYENESLGVENIEDDFIETEEDKKIPAN